MSLNKTDYVDYVMSNIDALMSAITINIEQSIQIMINLKK